MALLLHFLLLTYSLCWYGEFHLLNNPPTQNVLIYYLSLCHLILSFAYFLLFIHPFNMLVGNTKPIRCLKELNAHKSVIDEANQHESVETVNPPETGSMSKKSTAPQITTSNYIVSCLMNQSKFDNEALHRKARLTKSGSFPAATSSRMRRQGPTKLDHKQREIWPPSQGKESANGLENSFAKLMPVMCEDSERSSQGTTNSSKGDLKLMKQVCENSSKREFKRCVFRRGLSLSELEYNSFLLDMNTKDFSSDNSGETDVEDDSVEITMAIGCKRYEKTVFTSEDWEAGILGKSENVEIPECGQFSPIEIADEEYNSVLNYVKHVLELSEFTRKNQPYTWYSFEQPLSPDIFEELETHYCDLDLQKSSSKSEEGKRVRKLIFDLINEALLYVNERPYLHYPMALSFKCNVYPIPKGLRLLDEVWEFVGRSLNWIPDMDTLLESAVVHESNGHGGWMNLQIESECIALEVEDLILDELLDEILLAC